MRKMHRLPNGFGSIKKLSGEKVEKLGFSEGTERLKLLNVRTKYIRPRNIDVWEALIKRIEHNSLVFTLYLSGSVAHILERTAMKKRKRMKRNGRMNR